MSRRPLRIATCARLPEPDGDAAPLAAALAARGIPSELLAWDDPAAAWDASAPTILRSTWNYALDVDSFLAWLDRVATAGPVWNPPAIVRANVHKRYLLALAARGVPVVPTRLVERGEVAAVRSIAAVLGADRIVIKPEVGAGSLGARAFDLATSSAEADAHLASLTTAGAALVQPYLTSIDTHAGGHGERSLVWIDGALSHAIRKHPRFAGEHERVEGPVPIDADERAVAEAALAPLADQLLYARVDLARAPTGQPVVMELELVEPSLFFTYGGDAADRYVAGLARRLDTAGWTS